MQCCEDVGRTDSGEQHELVKMAVWNRGSRYGQITPPLNRGLCSSRRTPRKTFFKHVVSEWVVPTLGRDTGKSTIFPWHIMSVACKISAHFGVSGISASVRLIYSAEPKPLEPELLGPDHSKLGSLRGSQSQHHVKEFAVSERQFKFNYVIRDLSLHFPRIYSTCT